VNELGSKGANAVLANYWHPVAWSAAIGEAPYPTTLLDEPLVIWRDGTKVNAALDRCPHRGTALSLGTVEAGALVCPYHGWQFGSDGRCRHVPQLAPDAPIPPRARLASIAVVERYGLVFCCLGEPVAPIAAFPEWDDPRYRHVACPAYTWQCGAGRMVENFTDFGHLGYLHDGLLGSRDDLVVPRHHVDNHDLELRYALTMSVPNTNDSFAVTDVVAARGEQTNTYVLSLPFTIHLACRYHDHNSYRTLYFVAQPQSATTSTGYCYQSRNFDLDSADADFADFQELLARQDQPIVESQRPGEIPLFGSTGELHMSFDRVAIAYRRALAQLLAAPNGDDPSRSDGATGLRGT
jgi:phenylpropionate dioxygenase-like ring-hydroxylating dioxygenase large terminal subunit